MENAFVCGLWIAVQIRRWAAGLLSNRQNIGCVMLFDRRPLDACTATVGRKMQTSPIYRRMAADL
jgi:hypothetical protein